MLCFYIPNMTCDGCTKSVTKALLSVDPQARIETDLPAREVRVDSPLDESAFLAVLTEAGYPDKQWLEAMTDWFVVGLCRLAWIQLLYLCRIRQQWTTKNPVTDISFENNELFFRVPNARAEYSATFTDGGFKRNLKQGPRNMELTLVIIFKCDDTGAIAGTFQSPQQRNNPLKITTASLTGSTPAVALAVPPASFTGELDGARIIGNCTHGPNFMPLKLTK